MNSTLSDWNKKGFALTDAGLVKTEKLVAKGKVKKLPNIFTGEVNSVPDVLIVDRGIVFNNTVKRVKPSSVNIKTIIEKYQELNNVWDTGAALGLTGQHVHKQLVSAGVKLQNPRFTNEELQKISDLYNEGFKSGDGKLDMLADILKRTKQIICRKAKSMGFTNRGRQLCEDSIERISVNAIKRIGDKGHPKGMLGKNHTAETKLQIGIKFKEMWADPNSIVNSEVHRQMISDRSSKFMNSKTNEQSSNDYSRVRSGHIQIGDRDFFVRSSWEANIAAYYEFQKVNGLIIEWEYESVTFWFEAIRRGVRSYKPDFKITKADNSIYFTEVKGWMDPKSKTKLSRMAKYHPQVIIDLIDERRYKEICKVKNLIPFWGQLDKNKMPVKEIRL